MIRFFISLFLFLSCCQVVFGDIEPVEWRIPDIMLFKTWGFSPGEIADIAGEDQIVITGKPNAIKVWTKKYNQEVEYKDARIAYTATVLNAPEEMIRSIILNLSGEKPFKMIENIKVLEKNRNHTMIQYNERKSPIPLLRKPDFILQITEFESNTIGFLLHEGDVGAAVTYFEFFELSEKKTLLVMATWSDAKSASFSYRIILKAEPILELLQASMIDIAFVQEIKAAIVDLSGESKNKSDCADKLDKKIKMPYFSQKKDLNIETLLKLSRLGTVQFYHPMQRLDDNGEVIEFPEITTVCQISAPVKVVKPILSDYKKQKEYQPFYVDYKNNSKTKKDYSIMRYGFRLGPLKLGAKFQIDEYWVNEDIKEYRGTIKSDLRPLVSSMEFIEIPEDDSTLYVHTFGGIISDDAPFYVKLLRTLPSADLLLSGGFSLLTAKSGADWLNNGSKK